MAMPRQPKGDRVLQGRHVLAMVLGFFAVVIAVNAVFVVLALDSFSGLATDNAYLKGLDYNRTIASRAAQQSQGWQAGLAAARRPGSREVTLTLTVRDAADAPLDGLTVEGVLRRPVDDRYDRPLVFAAAGPGRYSATLPVPELGQWDARVTLRAADGGVHRLEQRLWLK